MSKNRLSDPPVGGITHEPPKRKYKLIDWEGATFKDHFVGFRDRSAIIVGPKRVDKKPESLFGKFAARQAPPPHVGTNAAPAPFGAGGAGSGIDK